LIEFTVDELLPVRTPFRLDLTADALRRLASNAVDVVTNDGTYLRAFTSDGNAAVLRVIQSEPSALHVQAAGMRAERARDLCVRMLGTDVDLRQWRQRAAKVPWVARLASALWGLRPPRYPTLWEACAHAIVFQQISISAASAIMYRVVTALSAPVTVGEVTLRPFPAPTALLEVHDRELRAAGLSANKTGHLRAVAEALERGDITEEEIERLPTIQAAERLVQLRGIGPWSAAVVLLRGFGRLDTFPLRDSGVARTAALLSGNSHIDLDDVLARLGPKRGMLYYHLLLGRLRNLTPAETD
jgi:DNA-3-methyladenine glycosylase II